MYGRKNRLKHEEMKWLSQPRRISPLIRTFPSYEQINHGALAWVFEVEHVTSNGKIKAKVPAVKHGENAYRMLGVINSTDFSSQVTVKDLGRKPIL